MRDGSGLPAVAAAAAAAPASAAAAAAASAAAVAAAATPASAAAAAVAAAAPAAAAAAVPAAAAAAARAVFTGLGLVDGEVAAHVVLAVEGGDGRLGLLVGGHLDEPEALGAAGVPVGDDLGALDGAVRGEQLLQV